MIGCSVEPVTAANSSARVFAVASLASEPIKQDRVDPLRLAHDLDELGVADLVDRLRGGVDRVLRRGVGRQQRHQALLQILFEHRKFEPVGRQDVGHPHRTAARAGDHRDAVAFGQFAEGKGGGDVERMVEVFAADDPVMAEDRIVDRPRMRQGAGMRGGGAPARLGAADLGEDHRLLGGRRLVGDGAEARRVPDAFEIGDEQCRRRRHRSSSRRSRAPRGRPGSRHWSDR